jgi:type IX secretion system PorP/SprF family membrane protein
MKLSIKLFSVLLTLFFVNNVYSQQDALFSQYMFNTLSINPAYAGSAGYLSLNAISRHQWVGLEGAPQTQTIVGHSPVTDELGTGVSIITDSYGPIRDVSIEANFSYMMQVSEKAHLSFGLMGGFNSIQIGLTQLDHTDPSDEAFHNDINNYRPIFGSGIYYSHSNKGYIGFSVPDLIETDFENKKSTWKYERHYFLIGGYIHPINQTIKLRGTSMLRYVDNMPLSAEFTGIGIYRDKLWLGLMYRYDAALGAIFCFQINQQIRVGYAYDYSTSVLSNFESGTHEIMLNYDFNYNSKNYTSPRYF